MKRSECKNWIGKKTTDFFVFVLCFRKRIRKSSECEIMLKMQVEKVSVYKK